MALMLPAGRGESPPPPRLSLEVHKELAACLTSLGCSLHHRPIFRVSS